MSEAGPTNAAPTTADKLWNFVHVQAAWFSCVLGAATHLVWLGIVGALICLALHVLRHGFNRPLRRGLATATVLWLILETVNRASGTVVPAADVLPAPLPTLWLLPLWWIFATAFSGSLSWMRGRTTIAVVMGIVFGPLGFVGGERLGALTLHGPLGTDVWFGYALLAAGWAVAMPVLLRATAAE